MRSDHHTRLQPLKKRPGAFAKAFALPGQTPNADCELHPGTIEAWTPDALFSLNPQGEAPNPQPLHHAALRELIQTGLTFHDSSAFLQLAVQLVAASLETKRAVFLELSPDGLSLKFRAGVGWEQKSAGHFALDARPGSESNLILQSATPVIWDGEWKEGQVAMTPSLGEQGMGHGIAVAVRVGVTAYGILVVGNAEPRRFTKANLRFLAQSACLVGLHLHRTQGRTLPHLLSQIAFPKDDAPEGYEWLSARLWDKSVELRKTNEDLHREVAERERAESDLKLLVEVTAAAGEAGDLPGMLNGCLKSICGLRDCLLGQAWLVDSEQGVLKCAAEAWHAASETAGIAEFRQKSLSLHLNRGNGLAGMVWESGRTAWAENLSEANLPRWQEAHAAGLQSAFAFPIISGGRLAAVLEFFLPEAQPPDGHLLGTLAKLGAHLGIVFERLEREGDLRRQRAFVDRLIGSSPEGIFAFDPECRLTVWNPGMERIFGVSANEALGRSAYDVLPFLREKGRDGLLREALAGRSAADKDRPYCLGNGDHQGFLEGYYSPIWDEGSDDGGRVIGGLGIVHDITERKQATQALFESEERFWTLVKNVKDYAIFMLDPQGRIASWNAGAERINGYRPKEVIGSHFSIFYPEEDVRSGEPERSLKVAAAEGRFEDEGWRLRKDGSRFWAHGITTALRDDDGNLRGFTKVTQDITERRKAEQKLRESEDRLRGILNNSPNPIFLKDTEGRYLLVNREFEQALGVTQEQVQDKTDHEVFPFEMAQAFRTNDLQVLRSGAPLEFEEVSFQEDGSHTSIVQKFPLRDERGEIYAIGGVATDITERIRTEQSLRDMSDQLLRLQDEERRRIARELHDSTAQTLTAAGLSLARLEYSAGPLRSAAAAALAESQQLIRRVAQEIRSVAYLLHPPDLRLGGLASGLETYARGFGKRTGIKVRVHTTVGLDHLPEGAALALYRVAQECLSNIHRHSGSRTAAVRLAVEDGEIRLKVTDRGRGMPPGGDGAPFGVGIPGMRGRLQQLGGKLEIRSGPKGTTVLARLPVTRRGDERESSIRSS